MRVPVIVIADCRNVADCYRERLEKGDFVDPVLPSGMILIALYCSSLSILQ